MCVRACVHVCVFKYKVETFFVSFVSSHAVVSSGGWYCKVWNKCSSPWSHPPLPQLPGSGKKVIQ